MHCTGSELCFAVSLSLTKHVMKAGAVDLESNSRASRKQAQWTGIV